MADVVKHSIAALQQFEGSVFSEAHHLAEYLQRHAV
jgi:hypothetical protein